MSEETSNRLEELILEKNLTMHVLGSTESNVLIVELSDNGQDIGTLLDATPVLRTASLPTATPPVAANNGELGRCYSTLPVYSPRLVTCPYCESKYTSCTKCISQKPFFCWLCIFFFF